MPPPPDDSFTIDCSQKEIDKLKAWREKATAQGHLADFLAGLQTINDRLTSDPLTWGNPLYRLRTLGLVMCVGFTSPLQVTYAVDEVRRLIHIKEFKLLPTHPLAGPP